MQQFTNTRVLYTYFKRIKDNCSVQFKFLYKLNHRPVGTLQDQHEASKIKHRRHNI